MKYTICKMKFRSLRLSVLTNRYVPNWYGDDTGRQQTSTFFIQLLVFTLFFLFGLGACTDKYGDIEYVQLSFEVDTDKLALPEGVTFNLSDAILTMEDFNRWTQVSTYSIVDIDQGITIRRGYYNNMTFTAILHYQQEGEHMSFPVTCALNGHKGSPQNMIHAQIKATLPLERSNK